MSVTVWIAKWSRQSEEEQKRGRYSLVLALLTVAAFVVSLFRALVTFTSLVRVRRVYELAYELALYELAQLIRPQMSSATNACRMQQQLKCPILGTILTVVNRARGNNRQYVFKSLGLALPWKIWHDQS